MQLAALFRNAPMASCNLQELNIQQIIFFFKQYKKHYGLKNSRNRSGKPGSPRTNDTRCGNLCSPSGIDHHANVERGAD